MCLENTDTDLAATYIKPCLIKIRLYTFTFLFQYRILTIKSQFSTFLITPNLTQYDSP